MTDRKSKKKAAGVRGYVGSRNKCHLYWRNMWKILHSITFYWRCVPLLLLSCTPSTFSAQNSLREERKSKSINSTQKIPSIFPQTIAISSWDFYSTWNSFFFDNSKRPSCVKTAPRQKRKFNCFPSKSFQFLCDKVFPAPQDLDGLELDLMKKGGKKKKKVKSVSPFAMNRGGVDFWENKQRNGGRRREPSQKTTSKS